MSDTGWKDEDEVTTTYGSIQLAQVQAYTAGQKFEQQRIIKLLEQHTHPEVEAEYLIDCYLCERYYGVGLAIALIKGDA